MKKKLFMRNVFKYYFKSIIHDCFITRNNDYLNCRKQENTFNIYSTSIPYYDITFLTLNCCLLINLLCPLLIIMRRLRHKECSNQTIPKRCFTQVLDSSRKLQRSCQNRVGKSQLTLDNTNVWLPNVTL